MRNKTSPVAVVAAVITWAVSSCVTAAGYTQSTGETPNVILLLPEHFRGWVCVDFGVAGASALPREGSAFIVSTRPGEIVKTSDKPRNFYGFSETWVEVAGQRRPLPQNVWAQKSASVKDSKQSLDRYCAFYGTVDEADAASEPPGSASSQHGVQGISAEEHEALVALYRSTNGDHWNHRFGWLGPPGTECQWHGVHCSLQFNEPRTVVALDLSQSNLAGAIPRRISELTQLKDLNVFGNHLSGMLPQSLIQRWLAGSLTISAEASLLTNVSRIEFESDPSELLCGLHRISLDSDGHAVLLTRRCRNASPGDRTTYCEVNEGKVGPGEFATLAWLLEKNGFFNLNSEYTLRGGAFTTEGTFERTRVVRDGKADEVENYNEAGPFDLWVIERAIEGVASTIEAEKSTTLPDCPKWSERR